MITNVCPNWPIALPPAYKRVPQFIAEFPPRIGGFFGKVDFSLFELRLHRLNLFLRKNALIFIVHNKLFRIFVASFGIT
jgi:hypothetical protein